MDSDHPTSSELEPIIIRWSGMRIVVGDKSAPTPTGPAKDVVIPTGPAAQAKRKPRKKNLKAAPAPVAETLPAETARPAGPAQPKPKPTPALKPKNPKPQKPAHFREINVLTSGMKWVAERSKVFVVIDLEFWEINNSFLTEIGIAVFDPTRLPKGGHPIVPKITSCHYVVAENKSKVNGKFVPNNMFNYSYGETLIMPMADCLQAVSDILATLAVNNNLVIVGHGVSGDLQMLRNQGCEIPPHEILDTFTMWRITRPYGFGSLSKILEYLCIPHALMHNAGNDAYLNMLLFLMLCDPVVRCEYHLDEHQEQEDINALQSCSQEKRGRGRKRDLPQAPRMAGADDAVSLMLGR